MPWIACECCAPEPQPRPIAAHHQRHVGQAVIHEMKLGGVRDQLVHGEQDEVRPVVHVYRAHAVHRRPGRDAHHPFLGQRRVEHPLRAEPLLQAARDAEHRARIVHALAQDEHRGVVLQGDRQRLIDGFRVAQHPPLRGVGRLVHQAVDQGFIPRHTKSSEW